MDWKLKKICANILEKETGYIKKIWGEYNTVCLAYPNRYSIGMTNLGFQTVYKIFNDQPSFLCERVFLPASGNDARFVSGTAGIVSLENQKSITEFDILAFSVSFENDYPNILKIINLAKIPLLAKDRSGKNPLIIGGGIALTLNPEPLADFFDVFILGEIEEVLPRFCSKFEEARRFGYGRKQFLKDTQESLNNIYVPSLYEVNYSTENKIQSMKPREDGLPQKIKIKRVKNINAFPTEEVISAPRTEMEDMFLVEVNRGCARGCRFCAAGFVYRPVRLRGIAEILESVNRGLKKKKKIGLIGTAVSDHPDLKNICKYIIAKKAQTGLGSLRIDQINESVVEIIRDGGIETVALAPEAGSQRMRDVLGKGITEEDIIHATELLAVKDISNIRLYFMIGLPGEDEKDIDAIIELTKKIQHHIRSKFEGKKKFRRVTLSINQFIPKPFTPFQWCSLDNVNIAGRKIRKIKDAFRRDKQIRIIHDVPKWNYVQTLLSQGDRQVGKILLAVNRLEGNWAKALKEVNINPDFYVYRQKQFDEILPWDIIDIGVSPQMLISECKKAMKII
ncbi:MAG: TIGR03960 family B12-binding radical SAM protein [Syntrophaceae bacterium]|nr:TIGR03960 family B12-binding radical SAM protein [Syntrophaceae bacterium]